MARRIRLLIVAFIVLSFVVSTGYTSFAATDPNDYQGDNPGYTDYTVRKTDESGRSYMYYRVSDERRTACSRMNEMANVSWSVNKTFSYECQGTTTTTIEAGRTYYGLPYTQKNRDYSNADSSIVQSRMTEAANGGTVKGVDGASAVTYALREGKGMTDSDTYLKVNDSAYLASAFFFDGTRAGGGTVVNSAGKSITFRDSLHHVGWYGNYSNYTSSLTTEEILGEICPDKDTGKSTYYPTGSGTFYSNVYAKVRPGDVLVKVSGSSGQTVLATAVKIVYKNGEIDPNQSKIYITDQNSPQLRVVDAGTSKWGSSWRRNYSGANSTFRMLRENGYLPVSVFDGTATYTVSYNANGGTGAPAAQTKNIYENIRLSSTAPKKTGYTFQGWEPLNDLNVKTYKPGDYYNEDTNNTLEAVWKANTCTVYYDANGGTGAPASQIKTYGQSLTLSGNTPARAGYTFVGWSRDRNSTSAQYSKGSTFTDDSMNANTSGGSLYLYAVWEKNSSGGDGHVHVWDAGTVVKPAKYLSVGVKTYVCTKCGETRSEVIPAKNVKKVTPARVRLSGAKVSGKKLTVKWKRIAKNTKGYQVSVKDRKTGKEKYHNVKQSKKTTLKKTIKKLKKGRKYSVRVRAYNVIGDEIIYGPWSNVKSGKI